MSRIRGKNTQLETLGFNILKAAGVRFRKYPQKIYGKPDAASKKLRIAFFFDSDFWHGYDFENTLKKRLPNDYWVQRIARNVQRDLDVTFKLQSEGWTVVRLWEHEIEKQPEMCVQKLIDILSRQVNRRMEKTDKVK